MSALPPVGAKAPSLSIADVSGETFDPAAAGARKSVLIFLRHLGCPICRMEIAELMRRGAEFQAAGADVTVFVDSPPESVRAFIAERKPPFRLIADPQGKAYAAYGMKRGGIGHFVAPGAALRSIRAMLRGHVHGRFEGSELQLPGDFILDENGIILHAHLGRHVGDNTPVDVLLRRVRGESEPSSETAGFSRRTFLVAAGTGAAGLAGGGVGGALYFNHRVAHVGDFPPDEVRALYAGKSNLLFGRFPDLVGRLPWMPLGAFPTPVEPLTPPEGSACRLWVKRDDIAGETYGGNKVRKLEHQLADALLNGAGSILTIGGLGSNQCLAAAMYGRQLGMEVDIALFDQPVDSYVRASLLAHAHHGAHMHYGGSFPATAWQATRAYKTRRRAGEAPYYIPPGATTPLANVGYVTAALELAEQVKAGLLPEPDRIYVPAGSCGTTAGLICGLKLAGLKTQVVAVQITSSLVVHVRRIRSLAEDTAALLRRFDQTVPAIEVTDQDFVVEGGYLGDGYGETTEAALEAIGWAKPELRLEPTYTGKAMAACLDYCREAGHGKTVLFWNTYNSRPVERASGPAALPPALRGLFDRS